MIAPIKAQVKAGNVSIDVADVEYSDAVRYCDEGLLETIDPAILPPAPDGTPATEDFIEGALTDCAVANIVWSTVFAYDAAKFKGRRAPDHRRPVRRQEIPRQARPAARGPSRTWKWR